jgi:hypothetical protein
MVKAMRMSPARLGASRIVIKIVKIFKLVYLLKLYVTRLYYGWYEMKVLFFVICCCKKQQTGR